MRTQSIEELNYLAQQSSSLSEVSQSVGPIAYCQLDVLLFSVGALATLSFQDEHSWVHLLFTIWTEIAEVNLEPKQ